MSRREDPIGVFDSGVGGISTLGAMVRLLPAERFIYFGDTRNAPYGTKTTDEVIRCVQDVVTELEKERIKALAIACNTATGAAAAVLRAEKDYPVIGIEPALKPAWEAKPTERILVLATPLTIRQEKFARLMAQYGEHAVPLPCEGLMELVEKEDEKGARRYLEEIFDREDLAVEIVVFISFRAFFVAVYGKFIALFTGDAVNFREIVGCRAVGKVAVFFR
mgnify:CR=1 FL=1